MKHIKTVAGSCINKSTGAGCGECQASCQSACARTRKAFFAKGKNGSLSCATGASYLFVRKMRPRCALRRLKENRI